MARSLGACVRAHARTLGHVARAQGPPRGRGQRRQDFRTTLRCGRPGPCTRDAARSRQSQPSIPGVPLGSGGRQATPDGAPRDLGCGAGLPPHLQGCGRHRRMEGTGLTRPRPPRWSSRQRRGSAGLRALPCRASRSPADYPNVLKTLAHRPYKLPEAAPIWVDPTRALYPHAVLRPGRRRLLGHRATLRPRAEGTAW